jgi:hypothetical protein
MCSTNLNERTGLFHQESAWLFSGLGQPETWRKPARYEVCLIHPGGCFRISTKATESIVSAVRKLTMVYLSLDLENGFNSEVKGDLQDVGDSNLPPFALYGFAGGLPQTTDCPTT